MVRTYAVIASILALSGCTHVTRGSGFGPLYTSDGVEIRGTGEGCSVFGSYGYDGKGRRAVKFYKVTIADHGAERRDVEFVFSRPQFGEKSGAGMEEGARAYSREFMHACSVLLEASPEKRDEYARYFEEAVVLTFEFLTRAEKVSNDSEFEIEDRKYNTRYKEMTCRRPFPSPSEPWCTR